MLKIVFAESECMVKKFLSNTTRATKKERWSVYLGGIPY